MKNKTTKIKKKNSKKPVKIDVIIKQSFGVPLHKNSVSVEIPEYVNIWKEQVWAEKNFGSPTLEKKDRPQIHPDILQIWKEDVMENKTLLDFQNWMK